MSHSDQTDRQYQAKAVILPVLSRQGRRAVPQLGRDIMRGVHRARDEEFNRLAWLRRHPEEARALL